LIIPDHALGPPVLRTLSLRTCRRHYPGTATGGIASLTPSQSCQPSLIWPSGRPVHRPFRGLLGVHSRYGLHTRAVTVYRDTLSKAFSHFVTSIAAPVASGWSVCRVGLAPTYMRAPRVKTFFRDQHFFSSYVSRGFARAQSWGIDGTAGPIAWPR